MTRPFALVALLGLAVAAIILSGCYYETEPPEPLIEQHPRQDGLETLPKGDGLEAYEPGCEPIVTDPPLPHLDKYDCLIRDAVMHEFPAGDPAEIKRQIHQESSGRERAVSHADAHGLMQLKPGTFRQMLPRAQDIFDPEDNIMAGGLYRQWCADFWHKGLRSEAERNGPLSLLCYHDGPRGGLEAQSECGGYTFAEFGPCASPAAQHYVAVIWRPSS